MSLTLIRALRQPVQIRRTYSTRTRAAGRGQNLSDRYIRLEKSLREKQALRAGTERLEFKSQNEASHLPRLTPTKPMNIFRGLVVPDKPRPPESDGLYTSKRSR
ncbi:hypothetical protein CPB85DRAFT_1315190 [Mucidula mucida]|nr:hypothetical protein CPB85DRAFT_1315190 [Mucidula mucida]